MPVIVGCARQPSLLTPGKAAVLFAERLIAAETAGSSAAIQLDSNTQVGEMRVACHIVRF